VLRTESKMANRAVETSRRSQRSEGKDGGKRSTKRSTAKTTKKKQNPKATKKQSALIKAAADRRRQAQQAEVKAAAKKAIDRHGTAETRGGVPWPNSAILDAHAEDSVDVSFLAEDREAMERAYSQFDEEPQFFDSQAAQERHDDLERAHRAETYKKRGEVYIRDRVFRLLKFNETGDRYFLSVKAQIRDACLQSHRCGVNGPKQKSIEIFDASVFPHLLNSYKSILRTRRRAVAQGMQKITIGG
jgi:hypothetical protein